MERDLKKNFPKVFEKGLGLAKIKAKLILKPEVNPVFCRARPVPYSARELVENELNRLESIGVIKKVEYTEWAAPMVVVMKPNGQVRICCDYSTGLNDCLMSNQHPLPLPEDIFATLDGGEIFSQLDFSDAYLQIELDEESREFCSINTHKGTYQFQRLPFGVKSGPGIFQSIVDRMLDGLEFAKGYIDDVIIVSRNIEEHREHIEEVFKRISDFGFRIKLEKCSFFKPSIKYLGFIIDKDGRRPNPSHIKAISEMPKPNNISTLRSFLGLVNYYQSFVNNMRFIRKPLDDLLKK